MAINFPDSPTNGQVYTVGSRAWAWNSANSTWDAASPNSILVFTGFDGGAASTTQFDLTLDLGAA